MLHALLLCLLCLSLPAASVRLLDGTEHSGDKLAIADGKLTIGETTVDLADVDRIVVGAEAGTGLEPRPERLIAVLADGGALPVDGVSSTAEDAVTLKVKDLELPLPLGKVIAWGSVADLGARETAQDLAVLTTGPLMGTVLGLPGGKLKMETDLHKEPVEIAWEQIKALRLKQKLKPPGKIHLAHTMVQGHRPLLLTPTWPPALAAAPEIVLADGPGGPTKPLLPTGSQPAAFVVRGNRRVYLSDLEPASVNEEGAFGVVWPHRRDANIDGSPCHVGGVHYDKCLVVHSKATLTWRLGKAYTRFSAVVGISDVQQKEGNCAVVIKGDGEELWRNDAVKVRAKPIACVIDNLDEVEVLELLVDYGERYDIGDHLALGDAWLVKQAD